MSRVSSRWCLPRPAVVSRVVSRCCLGRPCGQGVVPLSRPCTQWFASLVLSADREVSALSRCSLASVSGARAVTVWCRIRPRPSLTEVSRCRLGNTVGTHGAHTVWTHTMDTGFDYTLRALTVGHLLGEGTVDNTVETHCAHSLCADTEDGHCQYFLGQGTEEHTAWKHTADTHCGATLCKHTVHTRSGDVL